eukprot:4063368-Pleurochrysis_carterae.AAC.1
MKLNNNEHNGNTNRHATLMRSVIKRLMRRLEENCKSVSNNGAHRSAIVSNTEERTVKYP